MAWNKPGGDNNNDQKDPWTGKQKPSGPPDLETLLRDWHKRVKQFLSKQRPVKEGGPTSPRPGAIGGLSLGMIASLILLIWFFWGIFIVGPAEKAVILRFGKYVETLGPGPHWIPRFIESAYKVNEQSISNYSYNAEMLTKDQNIVSVAVAVQYRIGNARDYLFQAVKPTDSLQQATASALRQVIGQTNLNQVLTSGREQIRKQIQIQLISILAKYQTGLLITDIAMQPAKAPDEVKEAFDDAIKAQEDEQRFENQAQAYAMQVIPTAKGQAQRQIADAKGYQQQVILKAQAETAPFLALLPEYQKSPQVTRERLYLDTLQTVLTNSSKILVDSNANNMLYLPVDKLLEKTAPSNSPLTPSTASAPSPSMSSSSTTSEQNDTTATSGYSSNSKMSEGY